MTGYDFEHQNVSDIPVTTEIPTRNSLLLIMSMIPNSDSNHHAWYSSSGTLDDAPHKMAFNGSASKAGEAISVPKLKQDSSEKTSFCQSACQFSCRHAHFGRRRLWFYQRRIVFKGTLACSARCSRWWRIVEVNNNMPVSELQCFVSCSDLAIQSVTVMWMKCLSSCAWRKISSSTAGFPTRPVLFCPVLPQLHSYLWITLHTIYYCAIKKPPPHRPSSIPLQAQ